MKINLDTRIRVKLTGMGRLLVAYWLQKRNSSLDSPLLSPSEIELPLWTFMSIFGDSALFAGIEKDYFPDGIEVPETVSE